MRIAVWILLAGANAAPLTAQVAAGEKLLQVRWVVDSERSLAWWQIDPHYGHLWATTCPSDPSWQAGEGRTNRVSYRKDPKIAQTDWRAARIPQWPRDSVRAVCRAAVSGEVAAAESRTWRAARGLVSVQVDSLTMGGSMHDKFMHGSVLHADRYPEMRFSLDSLVQVSGGDTLRAVAMGTLELHGARDQVGAPVVAWKEGDGLRVQAQFGVAATKMIEEYGMSRWALSLGIVLKRWNTLHMGVDLFLRPAGDN